MDKRQFGYPAAGRGGGQINRLIINFLNFPFFMREVAEWKGWWRGAGRYSALLGFPRTLGGAYYCGSRHRPLQTGDRNSVVTVWGNATG